MSPEPISAFPGSGNAGPDHAPGDLDILSFQALREVSMPVIIEIGRTNLTLSEILRLKPGNVVQLDRLVGESVDVLVSDRKIAEGEIVVLGDRFGVRITRVLGDAATGERS